MMSCDLNKDKTRQERKTALSRRVKIKRFLKRFQKEIKRVPGVLFTLENETS